ncbi:S49 family peptidase [Methylobacterium sp. NEAU 140]|uniref:S49 family peptidase n=1 Tax=Methylobacterium sp. NEAU 140 TaxID=3064945 RepID=UPI0027338091|nr:S49 family peptidase [Methylobacterium sp. NEAU 140]MDP4022055.1 S49 family peptidase [Methylobacterium sp. NEAU 140]
MMPFALSAAISMAWAIEEESLAKLIEIASREHEPSPQALEAYRAQTLAKAERATYRDGVAIVSVEGPLFKRANLMTEFCGATSYDVLRRDLQAAVDNPAVRAILLNVDSPGGEVAGACELAMAVRNVRGTKPIVAYVGDCGASAAYWLATAADSIVIGATAALGSIGVRVAYADTSTRDERTGVRRYEFVSSQSPFKKMDLSTDEGRGRVQARVDSLAQVFVETVAANRGVSVDTVLAAFGKGDVLIGSHAVAAGMADEIGTFEGTLAALSRGETVSRRPAPAAVTSKAARVPVPVVSVSASPQVPPAVLADRARAQAIINMTPAGVEAKAREAIRSGMSVEAFRDVLAARAILDAARLAQGR